MHQRVNVTLPEDTIQLIGKIVKRGDRSRFIDEAVKYYIDKLNKKNLKNQIKEGAIRRFDRDLQIVEEWFSLEEEAWQRSQK